MQLQCNYTVTLPRDQLQLQLRNCNWCQITIIIEIDPSTDGMHINKSWQEQKAKRKSILKVSLELSDNKRKKRANTCTIRCTKVEY